MTYSGETLSVLSARLGVPGCMLLRANRLYSEGWLVPGRELAEPASDFCEHDDFPCPRAALHRAARGDRHEGVSYPST